MSKYVYQGKEYSTIREIANEFNIRDSVVASRLRAGWTLEDAVKKPVKSMASKTEYKGVVYPSIAELARTFDVDIELLQTRLVLGWDIETALNTPVKSNSIEVVYKDKKYKSISSLSTELDIPYSILSHHYYRTQNIESAIEKSYESLNCQKPIVWNKEYDSYSQVASVYGVKVHNLIRKVNDGNTIEDAILYLLENEKIQFAGKEYNSIAELSADYKIQPTNVTGRIIQGWTLEEALTRPIRITPGFSTEYRGKKYISQISLCRDYGISFACIRELLRTHDTLSFMDMFEVFVKLKEKCLIPKSTQINVIPKCVINGKVYNRLEVFANEVNISTNNISTVKYRVGTNDLIDTLKNMQAKTVVRYIYNDKIVQSKELKKILNSRQIGKMADKKIYVPLYPALQKYDFSDNCFDSYKLFFEILSEAEMRVQESKNFDEDIYEETEGLMMGGM